MHIAAWLATVVAGQLEPLESTRTNPPEPGPLNEHIQMPPSSDAYEIPSADEFSASINDYVDPDIPIPFEPWNEERAFYHPSTLISGPRDQLLCELDDVRLDSGWDLGDCKTLNLRNVKLNQSDVDGLADSLMGNQWLLNLDLSNDLDLDLSNAGIGARGASRIAAAITPPRKSDVHTLLLGNNAIGDAGAEAVAKMVRFHRNLLRLDLGTNDIGDAGALALARALRANENLLLLGLAWNEIGDAGAVAFAEALRHGALELESLLLSVNMITEEGAVALLQALPHHKTIEDLTLDQCYASKKTQDDIARHLRKTHPHLTYRQEL